MAVGKKIKKRVVTFYYADDGVTIESAKGIMHIEVSDSNHNMGKPTTRPVPFEVLTGEGHADWDGKADTEINKNLATKG